MTLLVSINKSSARGCFLANKEESQTCMILVIQCLDIRGNKSDKDYTDMCKNVLRLVSAGYKTQSILL